MYMVSVYRSLLLVAIGVWGQGAEIISPSSVSSAKEVQESLTPHLAEGQQEGNWRPAPIDGWRGSYSHYDEERRVRTDFMNKLIQKGVGVGTSEVTAMAMGEDEIQNLPPAMVSHLITALLHIETVYKKSQMYLSGLDGAGQFLVSTALPAEQMRISFTVQALLSPVGILYGNDAIVKRIGQALSLFFQRQLSEPFPWTFALPTSSDRKSSSQPTETVQNLLDIFDTVADADAI